MSLNIYEKLDIPEGKKGVAVSREQAEFMYRFLKKKKVNVTLETGFAYGCSAAHIISATRKKHYVIDPFQEKFGNLGLKNIQRLGLNKFILFKKDFSHIILPKLVEEGVRLDFAFIDGGHNYDDVFVDFFYIDIMLKKQGYVLFHDSWMRSTQLVASWIKTNKRNYKSIKIPIKNLILFQKTGKDNRTWNHFKEFYSLRSIVGHNLFNLRYHENQSFGRGASKKTD